MIVDQGGEKMVAAYIFINTAPGTLKQAAEQIAVVEGVRSVEAITGPYDAIVQAEAPTNDELGKLVVSKIQTVPGVEKTLTCLVVELAEKAA